MHWLDESRHTASHDQTMPNCPRCRQPVRVSEVQLQHPPVSRGIQYWRCQGCGFLWVTIEGRTV
jgi:transposase-like protein